MTKFISVSLAAITLFSIIGVTPQVQASPSKRPAKTFVIVHGAWQAPYAWQTVKKELEIKGEKVIVVELPGHGSDTTPPQNLSIDVYRDKVIEAINSTQDKVILVGHSLAGVIISSVAEQVPDRIERLVYIGAFLPANGQSLLDLALTDGNSLLGKSLIPSEDKLTLGVKSENIIPIFCQDSPENIKKEVVDNYKPEPAIPFTNKVTLSDAKYGSVPKVYIHTMMDQAVSIDLQNRMVSAAGITDIYSLNSSHTPFLSMPEKVTALLLKIAKS